MTTSQPTGAEWPAYCAALSRLAQHLRGIAAELPANLPPGRDPVGVAAAACGLRAVRVPPAGLAADPNAVALVVDAEGRPACLLPGSRGRPPLASATAAWRLYARSLLPGMAWRSGVPVGLAVVLGTSLLAGAVSAALPFALGALGRRPVTEAALTGAGLLVIAVLVGARDRVAVVLQDRVQAVLEPMLWDRVVDHGRDGDRTRSADDLVAAATSVAQLRSLACPAVLDGLLVGFVAVSTCALLASVFVRLAAAELIVAALLAGALYWTARRHEPAHQGQRGEDLLHAALNAADEIHLYAREHTLIDRLVAARAERAHADAPRSRVEQRLAAIGAVAGFLSLGALVMAGITGLDLLVACGAVTQLVLVAGRIDNLVRSVLVVGRAVAVRGTALLVEPAAPTGRSRRVAPAPCEAVQLCGVSLRYPGLDRPALDELSLRVEPGEFIVVTGGSGAGKSSLLRLAAGVEAASRGEVRYDGVPLGELLPDAVRQQIGFVPEDCGLPRGTVRSVVLGAAGGDDDERAWVALRAVGLADYVAGLPMKLSTVVTGGTSGFAAGQRALMSLARALARQPSLLLLDAAAGATDYLADLIAGLPMTRIVVSHDRDLAAAADRVVVLEQGRVVASGHYRDLRTARAAVTYQFGMPEDTEGTRNLSKTH